MPVVVLVDTSLSMARMVRGKEEGEEILQLAVHGVNLLLDQLEANCKLEHVALLQFSSSCHMVQGFTRDLDLIRTKVATLQGQDRSSLEKGLQGVAGMVLEEWGTSTPITLIIVTDGGVGRGPYSLEQLANGGQTELLLPLPFPCALSVVCLADRALTPDLKKTKVAYESLFTRLGVETERGSFHQVEGSLNRRSAEVVFREVAALHCTKWQGRLELGADMAAQVQLCPPPKNFCKQDDFSVIRREVGESLVVRGFVSLSDIASPPVYSRHLVLPVPTSKERSVEEESKTPNLCVFLHGALKVENMCAVVEIGEEWWGVVYSWSDNKKKSSLMLSLFEPGVDAVPWLGPLNRLGSLSDLNETTNSPFPVKSERKPSYSSSPVVWIKNNGIQSDIQKVLRHARKLPEKTVQFYKELNRLKRAAVCLGFYELLEGVAQVEYAANMIYLKSKKKFTPPADLYIQPCSQSSHQHKHSWKSSGLCQVCERECSLLPTGVSPDCAIQLSYVAQVLRSPECYHVNHQVMPKLTQFNHGKC